MTIWTRGFAIALAERIIATFVFCLAGIITADGFDFEHMSWKKVLIAAAASAALSLAKGLVANAATKNGPSVTSSEQVVPAEPQPVGD
jgi:hypothetical protein